MKGRKEREKGDRGKRRGRERREDERGEGGKRGRRGMEKGEGEKGGRKRRVKFDERRITDSIACGSLSSLFSSTTCLHSLMLFLTLSLNSTLSLTNLSLSVKIQE